MQIRCTTCCELKSHGEFYVHPYGMHNRASKCKDCMKYYSNQRYADKKEEKKAAVRNYKKRSPKHNLSNSLKRALTRRPTEHPVTAGELYAMWERQEGRCPISGVKMTWAQGQILPTSLSIDRVDSGDGYTAQNVRLVCHAVNCFRGRMTDDEMYQMALAIVANMKRPRLRLVG